MGKYEPILKIAELGNITKAADELGYTQANVSHIIHRLEDEYKILLFHRERRGVVPTAAGRDIIDIMRKIEALENEIYLTAMSYRTEMLRVGTVFSVSGTVLPEVLTRFREKYPEAVLTLPEIEDWGGIERAVREREVDMAFYAGTYRSGFEFIPLLNDPYYVVVEEEHPLAGQESVTLEDLEDDTILLPSEGTTNAVIRNLVKEMHISPHIIPKFQGDRGTMALVEAGLGISILPGLTLLNSRRKIRAIPLDQRPYREVGFLCRSYYELPEAAKAFIKFTKEVIKENFPDQCC